MSNEEAPVINRSTITRRQALKVGGAAALGIAFSKPLVRTLAPKDVFASYSSHGEAGGTQSTGLVERWALNGGNGVILGTPVAQYFIPYLDDPFPADGDIHQHPVNSQHPNGARFDAVKHPGVNIVGWVDAACQIHLLEHHVTPVYAWRGGKITNLVTGKAADPEDGELVIRHDLSNNKTYDGYSHLKVNPALSNFDIVPDGTLLGWAHAAFAGFPIHLNYSETDADGNPVDPLAGRFSNSLCSPP